MFLSCACLLSPRAFKLIYRFSQQPLSQLYPFTLLYLRHGYASASQRPCVVGKTISIVNDANSRTRGPSPRRCYAAGRYDVTALTRTTACDRQGGTGWARRVEWRTPLCHCTGCVHTPGTQTENRPLRETKRKREREGETGMRWQRKRGVENGGTRNLRASVLRPSWGVAAVHCLSARRDAYPR